MSDAVTLVRELIPFSGLLLATFAIKVLADIFIHHDHPAYELKAQSVRFGQAFAIVGAVFIWSAFARSHHLPAQLLWVAFAAGSMIIGAIPVIATAIWKLRQVEH